MSFSTSAARRTPVSAFYAVALAATLGLGLATTTTASAVSIIQQPPVGTAAGPCLPQPLSFYITNYSAATGCSIGIATFYGFSASPNLVASSILVTPTPFIPAAVLVPNTPQGFRFSSNSTGNGPFLNATDSPTTYSFQYYIDPPIDILGLSLEDDPFPGGSSVTESACLGQVGVANCANPIVPLTINQTNQTASTPAFSTRFVDVVTTFNLPAGSAQNPTTIPTFTERVTVAAVPEPHETALLGLGGLMLLAARRRKSRNR